MAALLAAGALGAGLIGTAGAQSPGHSSTVEITQRDFRFHANVTSVPAGTVTFRVHNRGPSTHEFNVDRTELPDGSLPLRADGLTVNEVSYQSTDELTVHLKPGHYVLYCNLEGHYLGGMHVSLTVR